MEKRAFSLALGMKNDWNILEQLRCSCRRPGASLPDLRTAIANEYRVADLHLLTKGEPNISGFSPVDERRSGYFRIRVYRLKPIGIFLAESTNSARDCVCIAIVLRSKIRASRVLHGVPQVTASTYACIRAEIHPSTSRLLTGHFVKREVFGRVWSQISRCKLTERISLGFGLD